MAVFLKYAWIGVSDLPVCSVRMEKPYFIQIPDLQIFGSSRRVFKHMNGRRVNMSTVQKVMLNVKGGFNLG